MITILMPSDRSLLELARRIKTINKKIDTLEFQLLLNRLENDQTAVISTKFDINRLSEEKAELMNVINKI